MIPTISINPVSNEVDISLQAGSEGLSLLEDVLNLLESAFAEQKSSTKMHKIN